MKMPKVHRVNSLTPSLGSNAMERLRVKLGLSRWQFFRCWIWDLHRLRCWMFGGMSGPSIAYAELQAIVRAVDADVIDPYHVQNWYHLGGRNLVVFNCLRLSFSHSQTLRK